ncbi:hypothetical protein PV08_04937 [Exophiala spinifera]|uniref:Extracellular membrane protein CFEM domain-containing protein n=1 Tax=Exophiala spinifera TaxID=91928 RepID=A0A0D1ZYK2_9EURO|nr:uncharacterized protein PV08_04937 [Exophiala spinifera]KIW17742.1 hypothetical protein PV08_04937 [Exophiala spinifera]
MELPFLLSLTLMISSLTVLGQYGKWSDLPTCALGCLDRSTTTMEEYWPNGYLPVICGLSSPDHKAFKLALRSCFYESKAEGCNGTSGLTSLVDDTINLFCNLSSKDSTLFDSANLNGTMTTTRTSVTPDSSVLSAQWIPTLTADKDVSQDGTPVPPSPSDSSFATAAATPTADSVETSNLPSIAVSTRFRNLSSPPSTYTSRPPLPTLPGNELNSSTEVEVSTIYSTHVVTFSGSTSTSLTTSMYPESSLRTTTVVVTASSASVSSAGTASSGKMVMRSDMWYLFESFIGLVIYVTMRGEWYLG